MIKVAFQDIDSDAFKVAVIDGVQEEIKLCEGDEDFSRPLDFDRPLVIREDVSSTDLITFARYYTSILEESVSIISSDSFTSNDMNEISSSNVKIFNTLDEAIVNMKYDDNIYEGDVEAVES